MCANVLDSVAAASETGDSSAAEEAYDDGGDDDSDMYMEPDGAESSHHHQADLPGPTDPTTNLPIPTLLQHQQQQPPPRLTIVAVRPVKTSIKVSSSSESSSEPEPDSRSTSSITSDERTAVAPLDERSLESDSQNFFPSFAELFGAQRLPFADPQQQQQQAPQPRQYRPSRFLGYFSRERPYAVAASAPAKEALLGSGNFGVIRGGTYYPEDKEADEYSLDESAFSPFYRSASRYYKNPKPQPVRGGDFFANFRDFADITAPPKSSFSHLSVVYAAKNGPANTEQQPRNIIETLKMLEQQQQADNEKGIDEEDSDISTTSEMPQKKVSQGKRKLMKMKKYHEDKTSKKLAPRATVEPLLALS
ncbi:hypothetical protein QAD02_023874 [Eretmocerus hayati]|uniref:Uncharacterized protein n=1 Tax=Eretmocerus hayati TaxID=131215 RepID=A0ACC2PXS8_9HYME|nr:hypothetical protein QAD02_023874 [Eretmocerus hayati]